MESQPDFEPRELLTERVTFRLSREERDLLDRAARAYRTEAGRIVRRIVFKRLAELKGDIEQRLSSKEPALF